MKNLVICVDRDDDIGRKIKVNGPIIGVEKNISVAKDLALHDPEDTDTNAIFAAVKIAKENGWDVVTLTGDRRVGVISDIEIAKQMDIVMKRFNPEGVILVVDGAEDENILPIIESRTKINSVKTVIVRQSQELEKAYFKITHFIKEVEEDENLARLVFGIPGLVIMFLAIGSVLGIIIQAINIVLGIIGVYLLLKGFGYEEEFFSRISQFIHSLSVEKTSTITYILGFTIVLVGIAFGSVGVLDEQAIDLTEKTAIFIRKSADIVLAGLVVAVSGKIIDDYSSEKYLNVRTDLIFLAFMFLVKLTLHSWANWIDARITQDFLVATLFGVASFILVIMLTKYFFADEIKTRQSLIDKFAKKDVYNQKGDTIGRVERVILDCSRLTGIKVKRKIISKEDILLENGRIIIKTD